MLSDVARLIFLSDEYLIDLPDAVRLEDSVCWCFERSFDYPPLEGVLPPDELASIWSLAGVEPDPDDEVLRGTISSISEVRVRYVQVRPRVWDFVAGSARLVSRTDTYNHHLADPFTPDDAFGGYLAGVEADAP